MLKTSTGKESRLNVRVKGLLADHVNSLVGAEGLYDNQSEYLRDLIRKDMYQRDNDSLRQEIQLSYSQLSKGDYREVSVKSLYDEAVKELQEEGYQ
jgi:antitoxin ParD1/3/4